MMRSDNVNIKTKRELRDLFNASAACFAREVPNYHEDAKAFEIDTPAGVYHFHMIPDFDLRRCTPWIAGRFDNPRKAAELFPFAGVNPFSGKCNFMTITSPAQLQVILHRIASYAEKSE
jgi:hypothetical protein